MARVATNQSIVLQAVVDRLIGEIPEFSNSTCFLTTVPPDEPPANIRDNLFATVSPTNGRFREDVHEGAGIFGTFEEAGVMVTVFSSIRLDRIGHDSNLMMDTARGLFAIKHKIIKALSGHDLLDTAGNQILTNYMAPLTSDRPQSSRDAKTAAGDLSLVFSTDFEWDLT